MSQFSWVRSSDTGRGLIAQDTPPTSAQSASSTFTSVFHMAINRVSWIRYPGWRRGHEFDSYCINERIVDRYSSMPVKVSDMYVMLTRYWMTSGP